MTLARDSIKDFHFTMSYELIASGIFQNLVEVVTRKKYMLANWR